MTCLEVDEDVGSDVLVGVPRLVDLDEFRALSGARRDEAFMDVERELRRLQALQASMVSEVTRSRSFRDDYHRSATAWLRAVMNCAGSAATYRSRVAEMCDELPALAEAVAVGAIGDCQLRLLARLHANDRCRSWLPEFEELLVEFARSLTYHDFRQVCQRWEQQADPDGSHRDHELSRANRTVTCSRVGAGHVIGIEGDALTGAIITEILDAHAAAELETDLAERRERQGDDSTQPLARTNRQRRYDALVAIFLKAAGTRQTTERLPLVNIFCTEVALQTAITEHFGVVGSTDPPAVIAESLRLPYAQTASGAPVDLHDLAVAALIGQVRRVVVDSVGRVIDLGRRSRLFTGAAREAVLLAGDVCDFPGCRQHSVHLQIDHVTPWTHVGGETTSTNGAIACGTHNRARHHGRITVHRDESGWHYYRTDGTEIAPRNHS